MDECVCSVCGARLKRGEVALHYLKVHGGLLSADAGRLEELAVCNGAVSRAVVDYLREFLSAQAGWRASLTLSKLSRAVAGRLGVSENSVLHYALEVVREMSGRAVPGTEWLVVDVRQGRSRRKYRVRFKRARR